MGPLPFKKNLPTWYIINTISTNKQLESISTDPKFVELTPDVLKKKKSNVRVTAYQFGTVGLCPRDLLGSSRLLFSYRLDN